ncbi:sulfatase family protein [Flavilitoribacter nigricans]|uniref:Sulfatase n=1 Tax=Flavilitoribacter nigricans (strain ATCC 23147 / DSM 23189 / NBRC 102662 / NCIMB 1420 / SS-2) TaxID=1122177 RepID=A0A2D0NIT8_FLAN2|nr:arylsulfatase [Flavilitoribacter nigricans]PHN08109.1 sulfatase [Flavilitoribacter nigricans DSM 23189 = NBRC 102662]
MTKRFTYFLPLLLLFTGLSCTSEEQTEAADRPNIVYILADDLGYGDVAAYNPDSKLLTPNIDRLVSQGMRFTDAHSPSSVCTPTRYGILTGRYCWRSRLPQGVLRGYGRALLESGRSTVADLLQENGYTTGVVGKWHLGIDWVIQENYRDSINPQTASISAGGVVQEMNSDWLDFSEPPTDGPLDHGFDYSFVLPASLDMPPYCFLENDTLLSIPDGHTEGNDLDMGYYGAFWRAGRMSPDFKFEEVLPTFTEKAEGFIREQSGTADPFFLYFPLAAPHTPWVAKGEFVESSQAGDYGDFVQMVDATVGRIMAALESAGVADNTLLIFTSDNGPFWREDKIEEFDHRAAGDLRGMKSDIFEGGHRVPFVVRWPGRVQAGSQSTHTTTLTNLIATCADLLDTSLGTDTGEDSYSIWPVLMGEAEEAGPEQAVIHHSGSGHFAIRKGNWKLMEQLGSGGFTLPRTVEPEPGGPTGQLYNLAEDPLETTNLYLERPEVVAELLGELERIRQ